MNFNVSSHLLEVVGHCHLIRLVRIEGDDVGDAQATEPHAPPRNDQFGGIQSATRQSRLVDCLQPGRNLHDQRPDLVLRQHRPIGHCAGHGALMAKRTRIPAKGIRVSIVARAATAPIHSVMVVRRWCEILGQQRLRSSVVIVN